ncbi:hypothetical protein HYH02_012481 [Chlamydomonas schloesseri]|uniref:Uncharacterized protein n=1 Tax=Chlamydomonas schloesseri TaxID=2026947 RepID=A0A835SY74_9CHLO|nr:hypothetical protein HYH02_012481 [Chlamydomonas schloesseri]|eukprot:KAG2433936.1 hypothetical protein HYH02_012481 [Chlamydomonas schloesseri]
MQAPLLRNVRVHSGTSRPARGQLREEDTLLTYRRHQAQLSRQGVQTMYKSHQFVIGNNLRWLARSGTCLGGNCGRTFIHPNNTYAGAGLLLDTILDSASRGSYAYAMIRVPRDALPLRPAVC